VAENDVVNSGSGRAIFLVGPSSAGKSSLGKALVEVLSDPFMFFETDRCGLRGPRGRPELETSEREELVTRGAAFAIRGYLEAGVDLVVEIGLWHPMVRHMAAAVFEPFDAWLVGLQWDLAELERRERQRDDGVFPGTARSQATLRDAWSIPCDLLVDAVAKSPAAAAQEIVDWFSTGPKPQAIRRVASS
jgi:chloramphenicol 3-O phosphotransferase